MKAVSLSFLLILSAYGIRGHMQLSQPYPIRSPLNPANSHPEFSYTSPLSASGSDFPCKGYLGDAFRATAAYKAGEEYEIKIAGAASHGGGSCQISLSYDQGKAFKVIKSMIGGCPLGSYKFVIPADAPSGGAILAWTWFNRGGNREMYMNCAYVTVSGRSRQTVRVRSPHRGDTAPPSDGNATFDNLPGLFVANINQPSQCKTIEGVDVVFPHPGPDVEYGNGAGAKADKGYICSGSDGEAITPAFQQSSQTSRLSSFKLLAQSTQGLATGKVCQVQSPGASQSSSQPTPLWSNQTSTLPPQATTVKTSVTLRLSTLFPHTSPSTFANSVPSKTSDASGRAEATSSAVGSGSCVPGSIKCDSETTFSMCNGQGTGYISMGRVAAGTLCKNGVLG